MEQAIKIFVPGSWVIEVLEKSMAKEHKEIQKINRKIETEKADPMEYLERIDAHWNRIKDCRRAIEVIKKEYGWGNY